MNIYKLKFLASQLVMAFIPVLVFFMFLLLKGFWWALLMFLVSIGFAKLLADRLIRHPFLGFLFGEGVMTFTYDSKGIMFPILGKLTKDSVEIVTSENQIDSSPFDRNCIVYISQPIEGKIMTGILKEKEQEKRVKVLIFPEEEWKYRFSFMQFPAFLYNENLGMFLTKDWLGEQEKTVFRKHALLEFLHKIRDLSMYMRDFARLVVELSRKKKPWYSWILGNIWIILAIVVILMIAYLVLKGGAGISAGIVSPIVTPR